jgi:hypothetical protein
VRKYVAVLVVRIPFEGEDLKECAERSLPLEGMVEDALEDFLEGGDYGVPLVELSHTEVGSAD